LAAHRLEEARTVTIEDDDYVIEFEDELLQTRELRRAKAGLAAGAWMNGAVEDFLMSFAPSDPAYY
jgi:hypothetical protein